MDSTVTGRCIVLVAQAPDGNWAMVLYGLLLGAALVVGAILISLVGKWRKGFREKSLTPSDQLAQFRSLYEQGAISEEEFHRLRGLLGNQLKQALDIPAKPTTEDGIRGNPTAPPQSPNGSSLAGPPPEQIRPE
jgi:Short C-terminal domain